MGNVDGIRRMRLARKIQSAINGIWENEIIAMVAKGEIDMEYLDILTRNVLKLEEAYSETLVRYGLKITSNKTIHKCKFPGIPRRFEVEYDPNNKRPNNSPLTMWKECYEDCNNLDEASFIMLYNCYTGVFILGEVKDYFKGTLDSKRLKVHRIHVLEDATTVADMIDIDTNKPYRFNMTEDILKLIDKK